MLTASDHVQIQTVVTPPRTTHTLTEASFRWQMRNAGIPAAGVEVVAMLVGLRTSQPCSSNG
jgi:hypothetical protein